MIGSSAQFRHCNVGRAAFQPTDFKRALHQHVEKPRLHYHQVEERKELLEGVPTLLTVNLLQGTRLRGLAPLSSMSPPHDMPLVAPPITKSAIVRTDGTQPIWRSWSSDLGRETFVGTYRTLCLAPAPDFWRMLTTVPQTTVAA